MVSADRIRVFVDIHMIKGDSYPLARIGRQVHSLMLPYLGVGVSCIYCCPLRPGIVFIYRNLYLSSIQRRCVLPELPEPQQNLFFRYCCRQIHDRTDQPAVRTKRIITSQNRRRTVQTIISAPGSTIWLPNFPHTIVNLPFRIRRLKPFPEDSFLLICYDTEC